MPQLDTIYIFMTFVWTWATINLITRTIKSTLLTKTPKTKHTNTKNPTPTLPWT